jgi:hypothetical protein
VSRFSIRRSFYSVFLLILTLTACQQNKSPNQSLERLPQDPVIQVYFNQNSISSYKDPYRHFNRKGDNLEQQVINTISQANSTIDLAVMECERARN